MIYQPIPDKCCLNCAQWMPATVEYFRASGGARLRGKCRNCGREDHKRWRESHPNASAERGKKWRSTNQNWNKEYNRQYQIDHREAINKRQSDWRKTNIGRVRERGNRNSRKWRERHPERRKRSIRKYEATNWWKIREGRRHYRDSHKEQCRILHQKRRTRLRGLPSSFTVQDWQQALDYWYGVCAYCGKPPSLFDHYATMHQDHFVPSTLGGGYTPDNILPACQSCNLAKNNKEPQQWVIEHFGSHKAKKILKRIEEYFQWVKVPK